ncbi:MAG: outer membrane lipoprotein-sorting protein [Spirochaeta sp.]
MQTKTIRKSIIVVSIAVIFIAVSSPVFSITGEEIIERMEENQTHETSRMEGRMIISDRFGDRTSTFEMYSEGSERFLVEFTSPNEEGQRVLRRDDSLYLFYPDARETIRIQGAALRDSLLGSDISYEDMTGGRGLAENYSFELIGEETVQDHTVYKVELSAGTTDVAYPTQIYWIDTEQFVLRKSEQYARSGRLLKTTEILETMERGEYLFPSRIRITDETRRSSGTVMEIAEAEVDIDLPDDTFSLERLTW